MTIGTPRPFHDQSDTLTVALNLRQIRPDHEIADLILAAGD